MTGYTRQSTYSDGNTILAADSNNEYDALEIAMAAGTGHAHDNNSGQGAYVPLISNVANSRTVTITASGALTTGDHQVTGQIISDAGPITATLGNIVAAAGSVDATVGAVSAGTTVTAGTGITVTTGNITMTAGGATVDGRDLTVDGTKLDGIEANAKDDQTAAEVVSTPAGNLVATDVQAALNELDVEKAALAGAAFTGAITTTSTFDGRDVSVDGTKLDGIETAATADQTAAEVVSTPAGNLAATDVQAALNELDNEKAKLTGDDFTGTVSTTTDFTLKTNSSSQLLGTTTGASTVQIARIDGSDRVQVGGSTQPTLITSSIDPVINTGSGDQKIFHEGNSEAPSTWVSFNGTGVVSIQDDLNVTSITDNAVGNYTVNITTALANSLYAPIISSENALAAGSSTGADTRTTSSFRILSRNLSATLTDNSLIAAAIFGG